MRSTLYLIPLYLIALVSKAQDCTHRNLSERFDFRLKFGYADEPVLSQVSVSIIDRRNPGNVQTVAVKGEGFHTDSFSDCGSVRSYSTKVNDALPSGGENDSGDFIVADFNFDGREDFAVKRDSGGNGGPLYDFFVQASDSKFHKDKYLSEKVEFFPISIDRKKKKLTTLVHANAREMCRQVFHYNQKTKTWQLVSKSFE